MLRMNQVVSVSRRDRLLALTLLVLVAVAVYRWTRFDLSVAALRGPDGDFETFRVLLLVAVPFVVLAVVAPIHELFHAVAARVLGQEPSSISFWLDGFNLAVSVGEGLTRLQFQCVLLAPLLLAILPLPMLAGSWSVVAYAWILVALLGGVNDVATAWACRVIDRNWVREKGGDARTHAFSHRASE